MTTGFPDYDLLIVGMGPVGAVAANLAGQAGFRTLVIEQDSEPYKLPRAIVFDSEIMRVFASIGLADEIPAVTKPLGGSVYLGADRKPIRTFRAHPRAHPIAWYPSNLFYQPQLETIIRAGLSRYPNVTVMSGHRLTDVAQDESGVTARATDATGATIEIGARYLFACDGASSAVRKALAIPLDDIGFEERWLVIDTNVHGPMRWPDTHEIPPEVRSNAFSLMVCDPERPATLIPGRGTHRRWEYMLLPGERDADVVTPDWLRTQIGCWIDPDHVEIIRTAVYRFRALVAHRWRAGRVMLLGDAAHQTPPFFGQGMCHGIRDAAQLIWKLKLVDSGVADHGLLDSYQVEREPHVRAIVNASVAAGAEVCKLDPAEAVARDAAFRAIECERAGQVAMTDIVPPIRDGIIDMKSGGMRLPEFVVLDSGVERHIDTLLDGRFTLLTLDPFDTPPEWDAIDGHIVDITDADADGRMTGWLGERAARWIIVRPDRYIYATGSGDPAPVMATLFDHLHLRRAAAPDQPTVSMEANRT
ncbi:bifunctional 3-(3-hydroxy-phenyl)propionate/3-hydroxycinnamic acid hydroxylase [Sphingomonas sp. So64.6b]|uniref:bifunctional 3-(3-hydroxy-phenyl)propionate/3-hydroxycinnamic acid hydroxylase MhpA n=1 Tax=Sphingomonas sp. So64.6b TaxID=2997354 RepID=UPI001601C0A1|nr:bifunctional 3-(3-hydroxy-phenyl)propionate/3-hydroxycinnamic acid hydroxylase [Sphingomonas sp. So64.6b]QNA86452.1 bifunctional 3-(3-hydroxy-phenyl)propionate/3-hydroxycinnamic acid hydroxylase [Sphingomonas sp. So64.6b]